MDLYDLIANSCIVSSSNGNINFIRRPGHGGSWQRLHWSNYGCSSHSRAAASRSALGSGRGGHEPGGIVGVSGGS